MSLIFWAVVLIGGALIVMAPWIIRKFKMLTLRISIILCDVFVWGVRTYYRIKKAFLVKRDERRMAYAMKVFDEPVRWSK
jgi:hypothetical protein